MCRKSRPELAHARRQGLHNIGDAAERSGVSAKKIRFYERKGLIPAAGRTFAGYRIYSEADVLRFRFIKRTRALGFTIEQVRALLALWDDQARASCDVRALVNAHANALSARIREMKEARRILRALAARCPRTDHSDCPILEELASAAGASCVDEIA